MVQLLYQAPHEVVGMGLLHPALVGGDARGLFLSLRGAAGLPLLIR